MSTMQDRIAAMWDGKGKGTPARELPNNIEAEQAVLGAVLIDNRMMDRVSTLDPDDFHEEVHKRIFEECRKVHADGLPFNPITIKSGLDEKMIIADGMTLAQYLGRLCSEAITIKDVSHFAEIVKRLSLGRQTVGTGQILEEAGYLAARKSEFRKRLEEIKGHVDFILSGIDFDDRGEASFADGIDDTLDKTDDAARGREPVGIDPGIPEIFALTGPWQKGQLIIIGGGVKQGKSALAMQSMFTISEKHAVGCNSGEMSRAQLIMREKARRTGISATRQQRGNVSEQDMDDLVRAGAEMKRLKHISIDCRRMTIQQIDSHIGRLIAEHGIETYFLDHIGKIQWTGKMEYEDEFKQGQRATSLLKDMAQKHAIPLVALTHLKKAAFQDYQGRNFKERLNAAMNRRPTYRDLVGNMDKDADQVLIVFQAKPIIAGMEPGENTDDHNVWQEAIEKVTGKAEIILSLSRESEFPRRKDIQWNGTTTSYGPEFSRAMNARGLFA